MAGFGLALMTFGMPTSLLNPKHAHAVAAADCKCLASSDCENGLYHGKIQHCGCEKDCGGGDQGHNIHWPGDSNAGTRLDEHDALRRYNAAHGDSALVAAEDCHCLTADSRKEYCDGNLGKHGQYKCGCDPNSCSKGEIEHWPGSSGGHQHHVVATAWPGSPGKRQQTSGQPPALVSEDRKTVTAADCKCLASSDCENGLYHGKIQHCGCEKDCGGGDQGHNIHWPGKGNEGKAHVKTEALNAADAEIEACKCLPDGECENQKEGGYKCGCDTATCILVHWPGGTGGDDQDAAPSPDASPSPETPDA